MTDWWFCILWRYGSNFVCSLVFPSSLLPFTKLLHDTPFFTLFWSASFRSCAFSAQITRRLSVGVRTRRCTDDFFDLLVWLSLFDTNDSPDVWHSFVFSKSVSFPSRFWPRWYSFSPRFRSGSVALPRLCLPPCCFDRNIESMQMFRFRLRLQLKMR